MRRNAAPVNVEVKQVIGALVRLLAAAGLRHVPGPESFRRAKFGGEGQVEVEFWQLLANILLTSRNQSKASEHTTPVLQQQVAVALWRTGYHGDWLYAGGVASSRDLLLALGWLFATGTLETLVMQRAQRLDRTVLTPPVTPQVSRELQEDSSPLRRLQWLVGCLRHGGRTLLSLQEERARLLHAVLSLSLCSSASSSSLDQSSTILREDRVDLQDLCNVLEAYLNWKKVEDVFWTWMDSVVDRHLSDPGAERPTNSCTRRMVTHHRGNQKLHQLLNLAAAESDQRDVSWTAAPPPAALRGPYRARLQVGAPPGRGGGPSDELSASQALQLLQHTEARLLDVRNGRRRDRRTQLQDLIGRQDELLLVPP